MMSCWAPAQLKSPFAWTRRPYSQPLCWSWGLAVLTHVIPTFFPGSPPVWGILSSALCDLPPDQNNTFPQILQIFYSVDGILSWFWFPGTDLFVVVVFLSLISSMGCREKRGVSLWNSP